MTEEKKAEVKQREVVVFAELPKQELRVLADKDGNEFEAMTTDEALTYCVNTLRKLEKSLI